MKQIQPVSIWYNGSIIPAIIFNMISVSDNLNTTAYFKYQLFSSDNIELTNGQIKMEGADYITYSSSTSSNEFAYTWGAAQLKLTLV